VLGMQNDHRSMRLGQGGASSASAPWRLAPTARSCLVARWRTGRCFADLNERRGHWRSEQFRLPLFSDFEAFCPCRGGVQSLFPTLLHHRVGKWPAALRGGVHVMVEKPIRRQPGGGTELTGAESPAPAAGGPHRNALQSRLPGVAQVVARGGGCGSSSRHSPMQRSRQTDVSGGCWI